MSAMADREVFTVKQVIVRVQAVLKSGVRRAATRKTEFLPLFRLDYRRDLPSDPVEAPAMKSPACGSRCGR